MNGCNMRNLSKNTVTISVVTYNSARHIVGLIDSLVEHTKQVDYHVYVIDNGSTDDTLKIIKQKQYDHVTVIENDRNYGYGAGHNKAIECVKSQYHLIINPDVKIIDDVIFRLTQYLETNDDIGLVTPKILHPDGRLQVLPKKNPKFIYLIARRIHLPFLSKFRHEYEMAENDVDSAFDIEFCTGAFMFARTSLLKKTGGFDERYFMYFEDADLTREIRRYARVQYNPDYVVFHEWERAGSKQLKFFLIQICSMMKYLRKWKKNKTSE